MSMSRVTFLKQACVALTPFLFLTNKKNLGQQCIAGPQI